MDQLQSVGEIMTASGMPYFGVAAFSGVEKHLIDCGAKKRLPAGARSVVVALFPYYVHGFMGEISRYAAGRDYHLVAGKRLSAAASLLCERFPSCRFEPFCDASPVPEVLAAARAGLGVIGANGLLITPRFGSFVFIGEIVTDLALPQSENPVQSCVRCGRCLRACPGGAIGPEGLHTARCASHISQKKGTLGAEEEALLRAANTIWGCDICQNVCPMNRGAQETGIDAFKDDLVTTLAAGEIEREDFKRRYADRAFLWRGKNVLLRNIRILRGGRGHTDSEKS